VAEVGESRIPAFLSFDFLDASLDASDEKTFLFEKPLPHIWSALQSSIGSLPPYPQLL
jgi:hypothetical protein